MAPDRSARIQDLVEAMEAQLSILEDLLAVERKKTDLLVSGRADELEVLVRGEQALVWRLGRAEERRQRLQESLAASLGIEPAELTLSRLVAEASPTQRQGLEWIQQRYARTVTELQDCNHRNQELIRNALAYVDFALSLFQTPIPQGGTYTADGRPRAVTGRAMPRRRHLDGRT